MKKILLDMDGVLVDFVGGAFAWHGKTIPDAVPWSIWEAMGLSEREFWEPLGYDFWANLGWTEDGQDLVERLEEMAGTANIAILSSPCLTAGCAEGKLAWIKRHVPQFSRQYLLGPAKEFAASPDRVLVDDYWHNVEKFRKCGGAAVMVPRQWNALAHLCSGQKTDLDFVMVGVKSFLLGQSSGV